LDQYAGRVEDGCGNECSASIRGVKTGMIPSQMTSSSFMMLLHIILCILGSYITVSSDIGRVGDQVTLLSPTRTFDKGTLLSFYYHMRISDEDTTAALTVYTYSQLHVYERRLIEIRGNHGTTWQQESVCLPGGTYQLAFVATHGLQFLSDIALDEIKLEFNSDCLSENNSVRGKEAII